MPKFLLFSSDGFMPHGHCYLWNAGLLRTMAVTDLLIFFAYISISVCLYILIRKIKLPFSGVVLSFGLFIAACGTTHLLEVYTLWVPVYWLAAAVKAVTAAASVVTAIWLFPLMPKIMVLAKSKEEAESASRELETFSYSVAHDLRAPLRSMMGFSNAILEDFGETMKPEAIEDIKKVINAAKKMGDLIDGLLSLSRLSRGEIKKESVDLSRVVKTLCDDLSHGQPERKVCFIISKNIVVKGDSQLLLAMMTNLLSNAWKFTSKTENARIEFGQVVKDRSTGYYYVRDNGAGFDMKYADKLFGPFQRLHSAKEFGGNGIGLATVQRIVIRHGGKIWAEAEPDKGATFYFTV